MLRDWNGLSDTVLKVGHSVAEVICKKAPCQMRFERGARAHLADAGLGNVMFCCQELILGLLTEECF